MEIKVDIKQLAEEIFHVFKNDPEFGDYIQSKIEEVRKEKDEDYFTREQTASLIRVCMKTLDTRIRDGTIPSVKIGNRVLIPKSFFIKLNQPKTQEI